MKPIFRIHHLITTLIMFLISAFACTFSHSTGNNVSKNQRVHMSSNCLEMHTDLKFLEDKTLAYYPGSFDPLHKGHMELVEKSLELVDYIFIYPVPGKDRFKQRTDFNLRMKMIRSVYGNNPRVITTDMSPDQFQKKIREVSKIEIVGVIGSDTALEKDLKDDKTKRKYWSIFLKGIDLQKGSQYDKHANTSIGAISALKANKFIVSLRNNDNLESLPVTHQNGEKFRTLVDGRIIIREFRLKSNSISSTKVREHINTTEYNKEDLLNMIDPKVFDIIKDHQLYNVTPLAEKESHCIKAAKTLVEEFQALDDNKLDQLLASCDFKVSMPGSGGSCVTTYKGKNIFVLTRL